MQLTELITCLAATERAADARLQKLQGTMDYRSYSLYKISGREQSQIEADLGVRPVELVWQQMEGKSDEEKLREHVRRMISWCMLEALKARQDGLLPLLPVSSKLTALDAVRRGLEAEFGESTAFRMEGDIKSVLGKSIGDWLESDFIKWHTKVYKNRPIIWHLSSPRGSFECFLYIHKLDGDTLRKVQTLYLWPARRAAESQLAEARRDQDAGAKGAAHLVETAELTLEELKTFEDRLIAVIEAKVKCEIPEWAEGPYRNGAYDPVLDDGVKVNILPLQEGGLLRYGKVV